MFILGSDSWPGGAAECTAKVYTTTDGIRTTTLATLSFHVSRVYLPNIRQEGAATAALSGSLNTAFGNI